MTASTPRRLAADRELAAALVQASRTVTIITTSTIIIIIISERASQRADLELAAALAQASRGWAGGGVASERAWGAFPVAVWPGRSVGVGSPDG